MHYLTEWYAFFSLFFFTFLKNEKECFYTHVLILFYFLRIIHTHTDSHTCSYLATLLSIIIKVRKCKTKVSDATILVQGLK